MSGIPATKTARQARIVEVLEQRSIRSQSELARVLAADGLKATQARPISASEFTIPATRITRRWPKRSAAAPSSAGATAVVLPAPGGPLSRRWCPPAAATSRAVRASYWPTTSRMPP